MCGEGDIDERKAFIDATIASAKGGGEAIGPTRRGKGVKIMAIVDRHGLRLSVSTRAANRREVSLVQSSFDFYTIEAKPEPLICDRAYDSDDIHGQFKHGGVALIAPPRANRKLTTQDGWALRPYARCWLVECFIAWLQFKRCLLVRREYDPKDFLGFVELASVTMLLTRLRDRF